MAISLIALVAFTAPMASGAAVVTERLYDFGPDGSASTNFQRINGTAVDQQTGTVYVLDSEAGALYKFDAEGTPLDWGGAAPYISENRIDGLAPWVGTNESQIAVDSTNHIVYVTEKTSVRAFLENGEPAEFTAGPGAGTSEIPIPGEPVGVAVDSSGSIYASEYSGTISVFASSGEPITSFPISNPPSGNLGVGPDGTVYVVNTNTQEAGGGLYRFVPDEFPVSPSTTYTAIARINTPRTGNFIYGVGLDPDTGEIYQLLSNLNTSSIAKYDSEGNLLRFIGLENDEADLAVPGVAQGVAVVGGGEEFQFYMGGNGAAPKVAVFGEVVVEGPPAIVSTSAIDVTATSATLRAKINPDTDATSYRFEYGLGDCSVSACTSTPPGGGEIPAGHRPVEVAHDIGGLTAGTTYHYRVVAENSFGTTEGPDRTFTTQGSGLGFRLPDGRVWEMVSPPEKHGAHLGIASGPIRAGADGDGLVYHSNSSIESDPDGAREEPTILARRSVDGSWRSKDLSPPNDRVTEISVGQGSEYLAFTPNLSEALLEPRSGTLLSPEASERTPYLRQNTEPPVYTPLVTAKEPYANVPPGTEFGLEGHSQVGGVRSVGVNADLSHIALRSDAPLVEGAPTNALYDWSDGQIEPLSVLPAGEGGAIVAPAFVGSGQASVRNAVSEDGSRIFWSSSADSQHPNALYVRDTTARETGRLDVVQPGAGGAGFARPTFQGASVDGSVVLFTDTQQLTSNASPTGADLYRCELPPGPTSSGCATLTDLSVAIEAGASAELEGVAVAISADGGRIYFVARGILDEAPNGFGDSAVLGQPNLYLWQEGSGVRFVATLAADDRTVWGGISDGPDAYVLYLSASASPSGRYLAFTSERSLTGYDNGDAVNGEPVQEIYRYDLDNDRLDCVSCNPTGASPVSQITGSQLVDHNRLWSETPTAATLPEAFATGNVTSFYGPRGALDSGRIFFNAIDALVPGDSNGDWDVYQYEPLGVGDCTASATGGSIVRAAGGCIALISSGTAEVEAAFLDTSTTGDDAFFLTSSRLSVLDEDNEVDVYDARVGGVTAKREQIGECLGDACQPLAQPPHDPTPASAAFRGGGNVKPMRRKHCPKGKRGIRRKGRLRCVPKHRHPPRKQRAHQ